MTDKSYVTELPEEFLHLPTEKVVEVLIAKPKKITEIFGQRIGIFLSANLSDKSMIPIVSMVLYQLIGLLQEAARLKIELEQSREEIAVYLSDGFPV